MNLTPSKGSFTISPFMPLKHFTETFLVILLGVTMALTGLLVVTLPDLPQGSLPATILVLCTLVYPLLLHPHFRRRRADNPFRLLHFIPLLMVLVWVLLQGLAASEPGYIQALSAYEYAWTLPAVALGFTLLAAFCIHVIRRRGKRIVLLLLIFVPFAASALWSLEEQRLYERQLADLLWQGNWWDLTKEGRILAKVQKGVEPNLDESLDSAEEEWRERLRSQRRREERITERLKGGGESGVMVSSAASSSSVPVMMGRVEKPGKLTKSGPGGGYAFLGLLLLAGYTATLHGRARARG